MEFFQSAEPTVNLIAVFASNSKFLELLRKNDYEQLVDELVNETACLTRPVSVALRSKQSFTVLQFILTAKTQFRDLQAQIEGHFDRFDSRCINAVYNFLAIDSIVEAKFANFLLSTTEVNFDLLTSRDSKVELVARRKELESVCLANSVEMQVDTNKTPLRVFVLVNKTQMGSAVPTWLNNYKNFIFYVLSDIEVLLKLVDAASWQNPIL